jgi:2-polyprenyl-3-methyl-5-hydroxy-6-metoxy-1,4-benzoquinol methylase
MDEKEVFVEYYGSAKKREELAWHHKDPTGLLPKIVEQAEKPGKALDMGCGTGVDSVFLASKGWEVTSLDFMAEAIQMTNERAEENNVSLNAIQTDIIDWQCDEKFDLLVDAGLMHNLRRERILTYRDKVSHLLKSGGHFMLAHWESMNDDDRLSAGPRRSTQSQIEKHFAGTFGSPTEFERFQVQTCPLCSGEVCERKKEPACSEVGPKLSIAFYWFTK